MISGMPGSMSLAIPPLPKVDIPSGKLRFGNGGSRNYRNRHPQPRCAVALRFVSGQSSSPCFWSCIREARGGLRRRGDGGPLWNSTDLGEVRPAMRQTCPPLLLPLPRRCPSPPVGTQNAVLKFAIPGQTPFLFRLEEKSGLRGENQDLFCPESPEKGYPLYGEQGGWKGCQLLYGSESGNLWGLLSLPFRWRLTRLPGMRIPATAETPGRSSIPFPAVTFLSWPIPGYPMPKT